MDEKRVDLTVLRPYSNVDMDLICIVLVFKMASIYQVSSLD